MRSSKEAEKEYLRRSGSAEWERVKPFAPAGTHILHESLPLMHEFAVAVHALDLAPGHRVLDLGVGACWTTEWLARLNVEVVAADIARDMLAVGRERLAGLRAGLVTADLEALPFAPQSFDRALCLNALHHIPDPALALREIARVLTPAGRLVLVEPGKGHADRETSQIATREFGVLEQELEATHLMRLCRDAGFIDVVVRPLSYMSGEIELDREQLTRWQTWAKTKRPVRVFHKLRHLVLEAFGVRKEDELFEDALGMWFSRVLSRHVSEQSLLVAYKGADRSSARPYAAEVLVVDARRSDRSMHVAVRCRNVGTSPWRAAGARRVQLGVQLLDAAKSQVERDYYRVTLDHDLPPFGEWTPTFEVALPAADRSGFFRLDLVAEGVAWFESGGAEGVVIPIAPPAESR